MSPSSCEQKTDYLFAIANNSVMQQVAIFGIARRKTRQLHFENYETDLLLYQVNLERGGLNDT